jgi:hypothetical protein
LTIDQTQLLVPFGFISMLLCTLCLSPQAYARVGQRLRGHGLDELLLTVETFLNHLKFIETGTNGDEASSIEFYDRFKTVFEAVKQKAI